MHNLTSLAQVSMAPEFRCTDRYIATPELMAAVNAAMASSCPPLMVEPGTGKTLWRNEIARPSNKPFYEWHIKSTTKAQQRERVRIRSCAIRSSAIRASRTFTITS